MDNINFNAKNVSFSGIKSFFSKKEEANEDVKTQIADGDKKSMDVLSAKASVASASIKKQTPVKTIDDIKFKDGFAYDKETGLLYSGVVEGKGGYENSAITSTYKHGELQSSLGKLEDGRVFLKIETKKDGTKVEEQYFVTKEAGMEYDGTLLSKKTVQPEGFTEEISWLPGIEEPTDIKTVDPKHLIITTESRLMGKTILDKKQGTFMKLRKDGTLDYVSYLESGVNVSMHKDGETIKSISRPNGDIQAFDEDGNLEYEFKGEDYISYNKEGKIAFKIKRSEIERRIKQDLA